MADFKESLLTPSESVCLCMVSVKMWGLLLVQESGTWDLDEKDIE